MKTLSISFGSKILSGSGFTCCQLLLLQFIAPKVLNAYIYHNHTNLNCAPPGWRSLVVTGSCILYSHKSCVSFYFVRLSCFHLSTNNRTEIVYSEQLSIDLSEPKCISVCLYVQQFAFRNFA